MPGRSARPEAGLLHQERQRQLPRRAPRPARYWRQPRPKRQRQTPGQRRRGRPRVPRRATATSDPRPTRSSAGGKPLISVAEEDRALEPGLSPGHPPDSEPRHETGDCSPLRPWRETTRSSTVVPLTALSHTRRRAYEAGPGTDREMEPGAHPVFRKGAWQCRTVARSLTGARVWRDVHYGESRPQSCLEGSPGQSPSTTARSAVDGISPRSAPEVGEPGDGR